MVTVGSGGGTGTFCGRQRKNEPMPRRIRINSRPMPRLITISNWHDASNCTDYPRALQTLKFVQHQPCREIPAGSQCRDEPMIAGLVVILLWTCRHSRTPGPVPVASLPLLRHVAANASTL